MTRKNLKTSHTVNADGTISIEGVSHAQQQFMQQHGLNLISSVLAITRKKYGSSAVGPKGEMREDHSIAMTHLILNLQQDIVDIVAEKGLSQVNLLGLCALLSEICGQQFALGVLAQEVATGETTQLFDPHLPETIARIMEGGFLTGLHGAMAKHDALQKPLVAIPSDIGGSKYKH